MQETTEAAARCTLCPAGCEIELTTCGPNAWRMEYPPTESAGLCPRGSTLAELISHRLRILSPKMAGDDGRPRSVALGGAVQAVLDAAGGREIRVLLDGNVPCEQLVEASCWCDAWDRAKLCIVVEPADRDMLLGTEASGADYLADADLADCDGFLIVGDAFSANPICSRGFFDRRRSHSRTPVVVIDAACGTAWKFATHAVRVQAGEELPALAALAQAAGVATDEAGGATPSAAAAGKALAGCKRLGVLLAAEYGRTPAWRQIGYLAGRIAAALGGGVAPQTTGANALAAVRLAERLGCVSLAEALSADAVRVAVGCDVIGLLGGADVTVLAAAAALPNATTARAPVVLPVTLPGEFGGTYLLGGAKSAQIEPVLAPPAGIEAPGALVAALAAAAGVGPPRIPSELPLERLSPAAPPAAPAVETRPAPVLLLGRQVLHCGSGELTGHGSWQGAVQPLAALRICPEYAAELGVGDLSVVRVAGGGRSAAARVRFSPELPRGAIVLPEGLRDCRALLPGEIDPETETIVYNPTAVEVSV